MEYQQYEERKSQITKTSHKLVRTTSSLTLMADVKQNASQEHGSPVKK